MDNDLEKTLELLKLNHPEYTINNEEFKKIDPDTYFKIVILEKMIEERKKPIDPIYQKAVDKYHLKKHFGIITEAEIQSQHELYAFLAEENGLSFEKYIQFQNEETTYYDDVKVLLTYEYPYHLAYKIGSSIEESKFIDCSLYYNDIIKIVNIFLETGEKRHDV